MIKNNHYSGQMLHNIRKPLFFRQVIAVPNTITMITLQHNLFTLQQIIKTCLQLLFPGIVLYRRYSPA